MLYHVQIAREDLERLESSSHLSAEKLAAVLEEVGTHLGNVPDHVRADGRLGPGSPYFLFEYVFQDQGRLHHLLFYVNDTHAAAGVLVVTFVDHRLGSAR